MLFKVREFKILKLSYCAIFDCHLNYADTAWGQNRKSLNWLIICKKKLSHYEFWMQKCSFKSSFFRNEIIKLPDKFLMENCWFISRFVNFNLPSIFNPWFTFSSDSHNYKPLALQKVC